MATQSRLVYFLACAMVLVLCCLIAGCSSYQSPAAPAVETPVPAAGANSITIKNKNLAFSPATLTVKTGSAVTWMNQDGVTHTIASDSGSPVMFTSDPLATGALYQFTFNQPGTYRYHCSIHLSMKGTIIVQS